MFFADMLCVTKFDSVGGCNGVVVCISLQGVLVSVWVSVMV